MDLNAASPALAQIMLGRLKTLQETLKKTIDKDILPRLEDKRVSAEVKAALTAKLEDLKKSIREISLLTQRLERL